MFAYFTDHIDEDKAWACFPEGDDKGTAWDRMISYLHDLAEQFNGDEEYGMEIHHRILMAEDCSICDCADCPCRIEEMID